jgi:hypothetical protein
MHYKMGKFQKIVNWYTKGEMVDVKPPPKLGHKIMFYARAVIEATVYHIVGHDKFTKWLWLHDFFENWH